VALKLFTYSARVLKIVDGDTIDLMVDTGFEGYRKLRFRFARINAWEKRGEEREKGKLAQAFVEERTPVGSKIVIVTTVTKKGTDARGKYGRYLADIYFGENNDLNLNDALVEAGHARYQEY
jgi:micrococcal nuclease